MATRATTAAAYVDDVGAPPALASHGAAGSTQRTAIPPPTSGMTGVRSGSDASAAAAAGATGAAGGGAGAAAGAPLGAGSGVPAGGATVGTAAGASRIS